MTATLAAIHALELGSNGATSPQTNEPTRDTLFQSGLANNLNLAGSLNAPMMTWRQSTGGAVAWLLFRA